MEKKTILPVKIEGIVNGGAIAMVEGLRGFIPASKLSLSYIEDLETYLLKDVEVQVIDVDQAGNRLVLSARELLKEKERKETWQAHESFVEKSDSCSGMRCILRHMRRCQLSGSEFAGFR